MNLTAILVLAAGTYAFRAAGPLLRARLTSRVPPSRRASREPHAPETGEAALPPRVSEVLSVAATVLLVALVATSALTDGAAFAGVALPAGVLAGGLLAWRKAPFVVVVIVAAGVAAGLRALGVP
ncbi:AzlD domain-containing protein [Actinophytocola gossypii]|uniref:AzlD domain-containing protein n=1 Tax=Actinophytocola gossypii TaxID=2812003 RepID=A0ABT2J5N8_9PSEU|nr:AzlD domain-containing protein [Actinophytocola gossypii]MCT2583172.1 AzlD domain-containing protein [Actinophytocola gossypii]